MTPLAPINFPKAYKEILPELSKAFEDFLLKGEYVGKSTYTDLFESQVKEFTGAKYVIACKSGTAALQLALLAAGIEPGDEVITVANTYYATVHAIRSVGAVPIFCDILADTGLMDPDKAEGKITKKTKAILPVHLYGLPVDLGRLRIICEKYNLKLIEDCAHAFGSLYQGTPIGVDSDFACFSLYPTKNLGAFGNAGMILTNSAANAERIRQLIYFANDKRDSFDPKAIHARIDPLQACLLSINLKYFPDAAQHRKDISKIYFNRLQSWVRMLPALTSDEVTPYLFPIFVENRDALISYIRSRGIFLQIHYDINLHTLDQFGGSELGVLPMTEQHNRKVVSLSVHPSISRDDAELICASIIDFIKQS